MEDKKYIVVTGGAGYIGSHTVVELCGAGYVPLIIDDFRNSRKSVISQLEKLTNLPIEYKEIDLCNRTDLDNALTGYNVLGIIHFAAYKAVGESVKEPIKYYHNNLNSLLNVLDWAVVNKVKNFVFSSSCTVYGEPDGVKEVSEGVAAGKANSPYGQTKVIGEQILADVFNSGVDLNILELRYFNPIGAHESGLIGELPIGTPNNLLPYITQTAAGRLDKLTVYGNDYPTQDGTCIRDYVHVVDLAKAHVKGMDFLLKSPKGILESVNIGTGNGNSVLEVIETFERISNKKLNWEFGPRREGDVVEIYANVTKARELLGWEAGLSLEEAIRDAINWELKREL